MVIKKGKAQITFVFEPANKCQKVQVAGTFNNWQPHEGRMTRQKDGSFRKRFQLPPGQYRYKFLVDGSWTEDAKAEAQIPNEFGSVDSLVTVG